MNYVSYISTFVITIAVVLLVAGLSIGIKTLPVKPPEPQQLVKKKAPAKHRVVRRRRRPVLEQASVGVAPAVERDTAADGKTHENETDPKNVGLLRNREDTSAEFLPPPDAGILPGAPGTTRPQGDLESAPGYQAPPVSD